MNPMLMYIAGAVLTLAVLCIRSRAAGAALGILIGGLLCFVHELKGWDAAPVLAVCMLCGSVLAGFLRREAPSGGDGNFFGECCAAFRALAEKDFGLATAGWTDGRTLALGREFVNHVLSSPEPAGFIRDAAPSEFYLWTMSTPLLAGFFAAKTGRLDFRIADEKDAPVRAAAAMALQNVLHENPQKLFWALLHAFGPAFIGANAGAKGEAGGFQRTMHGGMLVYEGMRAAFQLGAAAAMGTGTAAFKPEDGGDGSADAARKTPDAAGCSVDEEDFFRESLESFRTVAEKEFGFEASGWQDRRILAFGREFAETLFASLDSVWFRKADDEEWLRQLLITSVLAGVAAARTGRLESGTSLIYADKSAREEAMLDLFGLLIFSRPFLRALFREHVSMLARHDDGSNGAQHLALGMKLTSAGVRAAFQTGAALALGQTEEDEE